jgi:hypothetical protein
MFRTCLCGMKTIVAHATDGALLVMEAEPSTDGAAVFHGEPNDDPTAIFGIETERDAAFFGVPFDADRYDRHECKKET